MVLGDVAIGGSSSGSRVSVATPGTVGSASADGAKGIEGFAGSDGMMCLSMIREKYINSSMFWNWVIVLSSF